MVPTRVCAFCGGPILTPNIRAKFCSSKCKGKDARSRNPEKLKEYKKTYAGRSMPTVRSCALCSTPFEAKNPRALYCSDKCKKERHKSTEKYKQSVAAYAKSEGRKKSLSKYSKSSKNKLNQERYRQTEGREKSHQKYYDSDQRKIKQKKYRSSEIGKANVRAQLWNRKALKKDRSDGTVTGRYLKSLKEASALFWAARGLNEEVMHLEHLVPLANGGMHSVHNVYYCPHKLNLAKRTKDPKTFFDSVAPDLYDSILALIEDCKTRYFKS